MDGGWIVIRNWDKFQHYRDREPVWIKNYVRLLHDDNYLGLTFHQRGLLHGLWIAYAASGRQIRDSTASVHRMLGQRTTNAQLLSLNRAGFIDVLASAELELEKNKKGLSTSGDVNNPRLVDLHGLLRLE